MRIRHLVLALTLVMAPRMAWAQETRGVVVDQTGSAIPGATVQVMNGTAVVATLTTDMDGGFTLPVVPPTATIVISLSGFQTARVSRDDVAQGQITLQIARTEQTATVVAPIGATAAPTNAVLGNTITSTNVTRLPSKNFKAKESLPLLPGVVRGP